MAIVDTMTGQTDMQFSFTLKRAAGGYFGGSDSMNHTFSTGFTDGTGASEAQIFLTGEGTVTFGAAITLSLADSVNPLSTFSAELPTADPEATKIRMLFVKNEDDTNFITLTQGVNALTDFNATVIYPGGAFMWIAPSGGITINDGIDDEITVQADTGDCLAKIAVVYG